MSGRSILVTEDRALPSSFKFGGRLWPTTAEPTHWAYKLLPLLMARRRVTIGASRSVVQLRWWRGHSGPARGVPRTRRIRTVLDLQKLYGQMNDALILSVQNFPATNAMNQCLETFAYRPNTCSKTMFGKDRCDARNKRVSKKETKTLRCVVQIVTSVPCHANPYISEKRQTRHAF